MIRKQDLLDRIEYLREDLLQSNLRRRDLEYMIEAIAEHLGVRVVRRPHQPLFIVEDLPDD